MSAIFDLRRTVASEHIDQLGHVNNVIYVQWMQDVATAHVDALGLGLKEYLELNHAMVAIEHHVQYRKAAFEGEEIILRTWLDAIDSLYLSRQYVFYRPKDQSVLFVAKTKWACVEISTGRPKRMSPTFTKTYQPLAKEVNPIDFTVNYL
ncbi:acyl-CoA thioesterase [Acinetobacter guerrae]|uniref:acyl-CoA thioesterase n=1 Tax=Acinetobacter guerrae TaxID=1843371 RepID=UPI00125FDA42|nr:thioesterase family protein [Acinetobacter guerrae]